MRRYIFVLLASVSWAATPQVEIRSNEIWILKDGDARQLTGDGRNKFQAVLSPAGNQIAYYECTESENCIPSIVILDPEGRRMKMFQPGCASISDISWVTETSIGIVCHITPSENEYLEIDLISEEKVQDLLGLAFTRSPDQKYVAHIGPIEHFLPRSSKSYQLYVDKTVVYPLAKGLLSMEKAPVWIGIHEFLPRLSWSPDSGRIAFVDCLFDWTEKMPIGEETNRRCFVAVVARDGRSHWLFPIGGSAIEDVRFGWDGPNQLLARIDGVFRGFNIPAE